MDESNPRFQEIVFMPRDESLEPLSILNDEGVEAAIAYLQQWDTGERGEPLERAELGAGAMDTVYYSKDGNYVMIVNTQMGYIELDFIVRKEVESNE